ncbi:MAG: IS1634 family transposase [Actinomycetota bacterium]
MASITGKKINGHTYYYLRETARVGGKPKVVSQRYLGKAEDIEAALAGSQASSHRTQHLAFGGLAAVWGMIQRLEVIETIDAVVGLRRSDAAASVGTYIALACLNRIVDPCSKLAFSDWWDKTSGPRITGLSGGPLDHRRFWDAMDAISEHDLVAIERALTERIVTDFSVDLDGLVLDMTNFATFIDSANQRNTIARRGHAKNKRVDLRLVGLALIVSRDGGVPLVHRAYEGNRPDVTQFASVVQELTARFSKLTDEVCDATVVYDAGNASVANQDLIEQRHLHYVCSLTTSHHKDLLAVPAARFKAVKDIDGVTAYETTKTALGAPRRVIVTHSEEFHNKQVAGFEQTLSKCRRQLDELQAVLRRGKARRSRAQIEAEIAKIVSPRWAKRVLKTTFTGEQAKDFRLTYRTDQRAYDKLEKEHFGKRVIITSHDDWPVAEVICAYRSQNDIEMSFRQMKDVRVVSFSPMRHWTDQKIKVHVFYCVLALAISQLMRREAEHAGYKMSVRELLATLASIQETVMIYPSTGGRPRARRVITERAAIAERLYELFGLARFAPTR